VIEGGQEAIAIFSAPGMNMAGRGQNMRLKLNKLDGILKIDINYILDTVSVSYDPEKVTLARIRKNIDII
jgi:copper chaperone CopZ